MILHVHAECCCGCLLFLRKGGQIILPLLLRHFVSLFFFFNFFLSIPTLSISIHLFLFYMGIFEFIAPFKTTKKSLKNSPSFNGLFLLLCLPWEKRRQKNQTKNVIKTKKKKPKKRHESLFDKPFYAIPYFHRNLISITPPALCPLYQPFSLRLSPFSGLIIFKNVLNLPPLPPL